MFERSSLSVVKSSCLRILTFPSTQLIIISSICIYFLLLYGPKYHNSYLLSTLSSLSVFSFFLGYLVWYINILLFTASPLPEFSSSWFTGLFPQSTRHCNRINYLSIKGLGIFIFQVNNENVIIESYIVHHKTDCQTGKINK